MYTPNLVLTCIVHRVSLLFQCTAPRCHTFSNLHALERVCRELFIELLGTTCINMFDRSCRGKHVSLIVRFPSHGRQGEEFELVNTCINMFDRSCRGKHVSLIVRFPSHGRQGEEFEVWSHSNESLASVRRHIYQR